MSPLLIVLLGLHIIFNTTARNVYTVMVNGQVIHEEVVADSLGILEFVTPEVTASPDTLSYFPAGATPDTMMNNGCEVS